MMHSSWIPYAIPLIFLVAAALSTVVFPGLALKLFTYAVLIFRSFPSVKGMTRGADADSADGMLQAAGYAYDPSQDIFYSVLDPWQKKYGYCRLYDEAAATMGIIIDCEPVYFEYGGKRWLIEFWKGQYDMAAGCEIGIYTASEPDSNIPGVFNGTFYEGAAESDYLKMYFSLIRNGTRFFSRSDLHWWLTGFKLGEFAEPSELKMNISIVLKDRDMLSAFLAGLKATGYTDNEIVSFGNVVSLVFSEPHSPQPLTRSKLTDELVQTKNKFLCDQFNEITSGCVTMQDKLNAVKERAPELYGHIIRLGRPEGIYQSYQDFWGERHE